MASHIISLDHPVDINGVSLRFIPVRVPTYLDHNEAMRLSLRKRDAERAALVRKLASQVSKEDMPKAIYGLALIRRVTGLPFDALMKIEHVDQQKISDFLAGSVNGGPTDG